MAEQVRKKQPPSVDEALSSYLSISKRTTLVKQKDRLKKLIAECPLKCLHEVFQSQDCDASSIYPPINTSGKMLKPQAVLDLIFYDTKKSQEIRCLSSNTWYDVANTIKCHRMLLFVAFVVEKNIYTNQPDSPIVTNLIEPGSAVESIYTTFKEVMVQLNVKYTMIHDGDCKHSFVFKTIRLPCINDINDESSYPLITFQRIIFKIKCDFCSEVAHLTTNGDKYSGRNPCNWCRNCFDEFHHDKDGKLLYNDFEITQINSENSF